MTAPTDLKSALTDLAKRSIGLMKACNNEESTKLYLVLPMLRALGYDILDPLEVYPNHETDPVTGPNGPQVFVADFAVLNAGAPTIAVASARHQADLATKRDAIALYFNAWPTTRLAIVTNGINFEFFVDSGERGVLDTEPFLTLDMQTIAASAPPEDVVEALQYATKASFDADRIAERAHLQLVKKRLRTAFVEEAQRPSDDLTRAMLGRIGFPNVRREAIERHYATLVKNAFEEALVLPVVQRLKAGGVNDGIASGIKLDVNPSLAAAEREVMLFNTLRRRLAYLVQDEAHFIAIDGLTFSDSVGKLVIYLDRDPDGRIVEIIRGAGTDKYIFGGTHPDVVTSNVFDVDAPLKAVFEARVASLGLTTEARQKKSA